MLSLFLFSIVKRDVQFNVIIRAFRAACDPAATHLSMNLINFLLLTEDVFLFPFKIAYDLFLDKICFFFVKFYKSRFLYNMCKCFII